MRRLDCASSRVRLLAHRLLRTRAQGTSVDALERAVRVQTSSKRLPPSATPLSSLTEELPHITQMQTDPDIWSAATITDAWKAMHKAMREARVCNPERAAELQGKDLKALAWCTAHSEIAYLLDIFSPRLKEAITSHPDFSTATVEEFYMHLGQDIEIRGDSWLIRLPPPSLEDLQHTLRTVGEFGDDGRGCVESTAHRVSVWRGRKGESLGITVRVGRYVPNAAQALYPLAAKGNILIISRAGLGKTTLLRDLAASIANSASSPRVAVVDTSNEIGGDGPLPMPFLGRCRRIQVPQRELQRKTMAEVIQNHSPEYLIVDELVSEAEAEAAWSISQRGVRLIATCHGETLEGLLQNQSLKLLVGGTAQAFLSNEERRLRNKEKKTVLERPYASPFHFVVEITNRNTGFLYVDVNRAVDLVLDDKKPKNDAAVGGDINLLLDLPQRLQKMIQRSPDDLIEASKRSSGQRISNNGKRNHGDKAKHKGNALKGDKDLYSELSGFL